MTYDSYQVKIAEQSRDDDERGKSVDRHGGGKKRSNEAAGEGGSAAVGDDQTREFDLTRQT